MKKRIEWIDVLKGFLLVCICFSHSNYFPVGIHQLVIPTGIVWVPCFFFLSGVLFSTKKYPKFINYLQNKAKTLLLPYCAFSLLFLLLDWNLYLHPKDFFISSIFNIVMGNGAFKSSPLWFLAVLFCVSVIFYLIDSICKVQLQKLFLVIVCSICGYLCFSFSISLPLKLDVSLSAMLFYGVGYMIKNLISDVNVCKSHIYVIFGGILISISISIFVKGYNHGAVLGQNDNKQLFPFCGKFYVWNSRHSSIF